MVAGWTGLLSAPCGRPGCPVPRPQLGRLRRLRTPCGLLARCSAAVTTPPTRIRPSSCQAQATPGSRRSRASPTCTWPRPCSPHCSSRRSMTPPHCPADPGSGGGTVDRGRGPAGSRHPADRPARPAARPARPRHRRPLRHRPRRAARHRLPTVSREDPIRRSSWVSEGSSPSPCPSPAHRPACRGSGSLAWSAPRCPPRERRRSRR
jgi:hypothetical protein